MLTFMLLSVFFVYYKSDRCFATCDITFWFLLYNTPVPAFSLLFHSYLFTVHPCMMLKMLSHFTSTLLFEMEDVPLVLASAFCMM
jgi:hypothetical protein